MIHLPGVHLTGPWDRFFVRCHVAVSLFLGSAVSLLLLSRKGISGFYERTELVVSEE